jgi:hypothetical protein
MGYSKYLEMRGEKKDLPHSLSNKQQKEDLAIMFWKQAE